MGGKGNQTKNNQGSALFVIICSHLFSFVIIQDVQDVQDFTYSASGPMDGFFPQRHHPPPQTVFVQQIQMFFRVGVVKTFEHLLKNAISQGVQAFAKDFFDVDGNVVHVVVLLKHHVVPFVKPIDKTRKLHSIDVLGVYGVCLKKKRRKGEGRNNVAAMWQQCGSKCGRRSVTFIHSIQSFNRSM